MIERRLRRLRDAGEDPGDGERGLVGVERWEVRRAAIGLVAEHASLDFGHDDLLLRAKVSAGPFFAAFGSLRNCLGEALGEETTKLCVAVLEAFLREPSRREGLRAAAYEGLGRLEADRDLAVFLVVCTGSAEDFCRPWRRELGGLVTDLVDAGSDDLGIASRQPHDVARQTASSLCAMLLAGLRPTACRAATELVPELIYVALLPYVGRELAEEELHRGPRDIALRRQEELRG